MGVYARLEREDGTAVTGLPDPTGGTFDAAGDFDRLLPEDPDRFPLWSGIDPYGDTVFNRPQMPRFIEELDTLLPGAKDGPERNGLLRLRSLAERCHDHVHLYVRFIGD